MTFAPCSDAILDVPTCRLGGSGCLREQPSREGGLSPFLRRLESDGHLLLLLLDGEASLLVRLALHAVLDLAAAWEEGRSSPFGTSPQSVPALAGDTEREVGNAWAETKSGL